MALPQRLVQGDADGIGEVERADGPEGRQPDVAVGVRVEERLGQAHAFAAEDERIARREAGDYVASGSVCGEKVQPAPRDLTPPGVQKVDKIQVAPQIDQVPVVEPRPPYGMRVHAKSEGSDEVQGRGRGRGQTGHVARVGRDLGLDQHEVQGRRKGRGAQAFLFGH